MSKLTSLTNQEKLLEARAIEELFGFIEDSLQEGQYFFKLQELHEMLTKRLQQFGIEKEKNRTKLKEKLLLEFPQATEQMIGKNVVISFPEGIKQLVKEAMEAKD